MKDSAWAQWRELEHRHEEFQRLMAMLVDFDERTGRHRESPEPEQHYLRRAVTVADPDDMRVFIRRLCGYAYYIVVEIRTGGSFCATAWVHEDGVQLERDHLRGEPDHPVHGLDCVSDFYRFSANAVPEDYEELAANDTTLDLMHSDVDWRWRPFVA